MNSATAFWLIAVTKRCFFFSLPSTQQLRLNRTSELASFVTLRLTNPNELLNTAPKGALCPINSHRRSNELLPRRMWRRSGVYNLNSSIYTIMSPLAGSPLCMSSAYRAVECNMVQCSSSSPLTDYHLTLPQKEPRSDFKPMSRWRATTAAGSAFFFYSQPFASAFISAGKNEKKIRSQITQGARRLSFAAPRANEG